MNSILSLLGTHQQIWAEFYPKVIGFFLGKGYKEVRTPILVKMPGTEPYIDYFETDQIDVNSEITRLFLRSSPEIALKKMVAQGETKIFEIAPCYRNRDNGPWHLNEFLMLEWYEVGLSLWQMMDMTEDFVQSLGYWEFLQGLDRPFERIALPELFREWTGIELQDQDESLADKLKGRFSIQGCESFEDAFFKVMIEGIEPALKKKSACFLYDYPPTFAALARVERGWAQRFELYIHGIEVCNAFDELSGTEANRQRLEASNILRLKTGRSLIPADEDFFSAMDHFPRCCGNALGLDRLVSLIFNVKPLS